jgi:hypothetical protein
MTMKLIITTLAGLGCLGFACYQLITRPVYYPLTVPLWFAGAVLFLFAAGIEIVQRLNGDDQ